MLEHREKVVSKDSEIEALAEETDEFDTESPLPKAVELDMNITDTDQTKVSFTKSANLIGRIAMKMSSFVHFFLFVLVFLLPLQETKTGHLNLGLCLNSEGTEE